MKFWALTALDRLYLKERKSPVLSIDFGSEVVVFHDTTISFEVFQLKHLRLLYALAKYPSEWLSYDSLLEFIECDPEVHFPPIVSRLRKILLAPMAGRLATVEGGFPTAAKQAYIAAKRKRTAPSVGGSGSNPYCLQLTAAQVEMIGEPPPSFCPDVELIKHYR